MYSGLKNLIEDYLFKHILTVSSLWHEVFTLLFTRTVEPFSVPSHIIVISTVDTTESNLLVA